jgi:hypothetical protein
MGPCAPRCSNCCRCFCAAPPPANHARGPSRARPAGRAAPHPLDALVQSPLHLLLDEPLGLQAPDLPCKPCTEVAGVEASDLRHAALAGEQVCVQLVVLRCTRWCERARACAVSRSRVRARSIVVNESVRVCAYAPSDELSGLPCGASFQRRPLDGDRPRGAPPVRHGARIDARCPAVRTSWPRGDTTPIPVTTTRRWLPFCVGIAARVPMGLLCTKGGGACQHGSLDLQGLRACRCCAAARAGLIYEGLLWPFCFQSHQANTSTQHWSRLISAWAPADETARTHPVQLARLHMSLLCLEFHGRWCNSTTCRLCAFVTPAVVTPAHLSTAAGRHPHTPPPADRAPLRLQQGHGQMKHRCSPGWVAGRATRCSSNMVPSATLPSCESGSAKAFRPRRKSNQ